MNYRRIGRTGLRVSTLCLGAMNFGWSADEPTSHAIMDAALDAGINFFDTADIYSYWVQGNQGGESESIIGSWFAARGSAARRRVVLATKVRGPMWKKANGRAWDDPNGEGLSRHHIIRACEDSLRRLKTDVIDLYQVHYVDPDTPLDETLWALDDLVRAGKVLYIGASNYPAWQMMKAYWLSDKHDWARFDCIQPHYSLLHRDEFERELEAVCLDQGVGVIPYSPLAAGFLTGKYTRDNTTPETARADSGLIRQLSVDPDAFVVLDEVKRIADEYHVPMAHVALAWLLARPSITSPIIGARTLGQLSEIIGAADLTLSADDLASLTAVSAKF